MGMLEGMRAATRRVRLESEFVGLEIGWGWWGAGNGEMSGRLLRAVCGFDGGVNKAR